MIKGNPISAYLIHSYLYYVCDMSIISDAEYDAICAELLARFDEIEHKHKHLLDKDALRAGSGFHIPTQNYPTVCRDIAMRLREDPGYLDKLDAKWRGRSAPTAEKTPASAPPRQAPKKPMSLLDF